MQLRVPHSISPKATPKRSKRKCPTISMERPPKLITISRHRTPSHFTRSTQHGASTPLHYGHIPHFLRPEEVFPLENRNPTNGNFTWLPDARPPRSLRATPLHPPAPPERRTHAPGNHFRTPRLTFIPTVRLSRRSGNYSRCNCICGFRHPLCCRVTRDLDREDP